MNSDIRDLTYVIEQRLGLLLLDAEAETNLATESKSLSQAVIHFVELSKEVEKLSRALKPLTKHIEKLSHETIPTMFQNQGQKTGNFIGVGRVTVVQKWTAKLLNPALAMQWLRDSGNGGVIRETVHHETLGVLAKEGALSQKPLPSDLFEVGTSNYTTVSKA